MARLYRLTRMIEETEQVVSLTATMTRAAIGLTAFGLNKSEQRDARRRERMREEERERRATQPFSFDQRTLRDIINEARSQPPSTFNHDEHDIQDAEVIDE